MNRKLTQVFYHPADFILIAILILFGALNLSHASDLVLWYQQPVSGLKDEPLISGKGQPTVGLGGGEGSHFMNEALPIGNGRLGGLIAGGTAHERIVLNEDSLWTGDENPRGDYDKMGAMCEMLVQSHEGEINLLPALPAAWPDGNVKGLRARSNFIVDIEWKDGKLTAATIHSLNGNPCHLRHGDATRLVKIKPGKSFHWDGMK